MFWITYLGAFQIFPIQSVLALLILAALIIYSLKTPRKGRAVSTIAFILSYLAIWWFVGYISLQAYVAEKATERQEMLMHRPSRDLETRQPVTS